MRISTKSSSLRIDIPDLWVWLKPTCPFRSVDAVEEAIQILRETPDANSVRIVSEADARVHRINKEGFLEPLLSEWIAPI